MNVFFMKQGKTILDFVQLKAPNSPILNELNELFRVKGNNFIMRFNFLIFN